MEDYLQSLKKEYENKEATLHLKMSGWNELEKRIDLITPRYKRPVWYGFALAFVVFVLFIGSLAGVYTLALAAMPGTPLYPAKIFSEKIIRKATGDNQTAINHRADEIINISNQQETDVKDLKQIVDQYKQNVDEAKSELKVNGKPSINLDKILEQQHSEFDKIGKEHPDLKVEIESAQKVSEQDSHPNENSENSSD